MKLLLTVFFFSIMCLCQQLPGREAKTGGWKLLVDDSFDRQNVGENWKLFSWNESDKIGPDQRYLGKDPAVMGTLAIENGWLTPRMNAGGFYFAQPVKGDVKVVYEAEWDASTGRSLVQYPIMLFVDRVFPISGLHLVHGKSLNTKNQILLYGVKKLATNKSPLPVAGKKVVFEAVVEGRHAILKVDGKTIFETEIAPDRKFRSDGYIMFGGSNGLLRYDRIKIYTKNPAPEPVKAVYEKTSHGRLEALMQLAADPMIPNATYRKLCLNIAELLDKNPGLDSAKKPGASPLAELARQMSTLTKPGLSVRKYGVGLWLEPRLSENHPFYQKFLLEYGRFIHAKAMESHLNGLFDKRDRLFAKLAKINPAFDIPKMYLGEKIPWGKELIIEDKNAPAWARLMSESYARYLAIINWWVTRRQDAKGELGGGWEDDVEILRLWAPVEICVDCHPAGRKGIKKLADGAWKYAEGGLQLGYTKIFKDVEHSSETVADSQPLMLAFDPENQTYIDRNLKLLGLTRNIWTAKTPQGFRHFKSIIMSAEKCDASPQLEGSVPYHLRAIKGLTWLMWQGNHPEVRKIWLELADAWLDATMRTDGGKLPGLVPASVAYSNGRLGGRFGTWIAPKYPWRYYNFTCDNQQRVFDLLTGAYIVTGNEKYFKPIAAALQLALEYTPGKTSPAKGTAEWQKMILSQWAEKGFFIPFLLRYRLHSGDTRFDRYLQSWASGKTESLRGAIDPALYRYFIHQDIPVIEKFYGKILRRLRMNFPMYTSEMPQTDRVIMEGAKETYQLMTGAAGQWGDAALPAHIVTWSHPNPKFAALVNPVKKDKVRILFYSFDNTNSNFGIRLWKFPKGKIRISWKSKEKGKWRDGQTLRFDYQILGQKFDLKLPAGKLVEINIDGDK